MSFERFNSDPTTPSPPLDKDSETPEKSSTFNPLHYERFKLENF